MDTTKRPRPQWARRIIRGLTWTPGETVLDPCRGESQAFYDALPHKSKVLVRN